MVPRVEHACPTPRRKLTVCEFGPMRQQCVPENGQQISRVETLLPTADHAVDRALVEWIQPIAVRRRSEAIVAPTLVLANVARVRNVGCLRVERGYADA